MTGLGFGMETLALVAALKQSVAIALGSVDVGISFLSQAARLTVCWLRGRGQEPLVRPSGRPLGPASMRQHVQPAWGQQAQRPCGAVW